MLSSDPTSSAGKSPAAQADERRARRSRWASAGVVLVLLMVSVFAVWSSQVTAQSGAWATAASRLSDSYQQAAGAVAAQEALQRTYRDGDRAAVRAQYDTATTDLLVALRTVSREGAAIDRAHSDEVLYAHQAYLGSIYRMFSAVDLRDDETAAYVDREEVGPRFAAIKADVDRAAETQHQLSLARLRDLEDLSRLTGYLTPGVFLAGLVLAGLLTRVTRGDRRLLAEQRGQAVHDAQHDALTGLPNRVLLADRFEQALREARRRGTAVGLLLLDLDRFKQVNDTFGHHYGDRLLADVAVRLRAALREPDTVARLGGDEFAVLLPDVTDTAAALGVAHKLVSAMHDPFVVEGVTLDVEASIGVVVSGEHGADAVTLLQRADVAMYVAKQQGLGAFAYDADVDENSPTRLGLLGELRTAIATGELRLHYQPQVSVRTGDVVGAEALVRWQHPVRGLVPPGEFIPLAEHSGLIGPLTAYVLDAALAQARRWVDVGRPLAVSVNLSARNLLDERLPEQVGELLRRHQVPPRLLRLELTESALITDPARAKDLLGRLAALGVALSVDDFGVGYTSISQLRDLPVTELKIDRSFLATLTSDTSNEVIVQSVIDLGHHLGLTIVAEGVEDAGTLAALRGHSCDVAQGYHLSRPVPAEQLDAWLVARTASTAPAARPLRAVAG